MALEPRVGHHPEKTMPGEVPRSMLWAMTRLRSAPWWVKRVLFTAVLWSVEAGVLLALAVLLSGFSISSFRAGLAMVAVISLLNALIWPFALWATFPFAFFTLGLFTLLLNGLVVWLSGVILPGVEVGFWDGVIVALTLAVVQVVLAALFNQADDSYDRRIIRRSARRERDPVRTDVPGVLFLEVDGLAKPVLERELAAGGMPCLARWLETGTHRLAGWTPDLSSQTGASQAGILLGHNDGVVAFRWWDREQRRVVSCSSLKDVAELEHELSDGTGLLHPEGASRGNLFSGDAGDWMLTSSKIVGERKRRHKYFGFYDNAYNVPRVLLLLVWEILLELGGQVRAWATNTRPRIHPHASYPLVRAATTVYLQLLTLYAVMRDVYLGVPAVYATFFAYDEVAHHSGIDRAAARRMLTRLDAAFERIEHAVRSASRPYRIVILSDHGQSQGATFRQRQGMTLQHLVEQLAGRGVSAAATDDEGSDRLGVALSEAAQGTSGTARAVRTVAPAVEDSTERTDAPIVALASGCLGLVYFTESTQRLTREEIERRYPRLLEQLVANADIGFVMVGTDGRGAVVLGRDGAHYLADDRVVGVDPLADYPAEAADHLRRTDRFPHVPDLLCNGRFDPETGEVPAFEELVGSHGGLGGTQAQPFVLHPVELELPEQPIVGAEALHRALKPWAASAMTKSAATQVRPAHGVPVNVTLDV
jgi:uncharacterized membrane protein YvlD (DUF360 family)